MCRSFLVLDCRLSVTADDLALAFGQPGRECLRTSAGSLWELCLSRTRPGGVVFCLSGSGRSGGWETGH